MPFLHALVTTVLLVLISVSMHYAVLHHWPKIERVIARRPRGRVLRLVLSLVILHTLEIFLLGLGFWYLGQIEGAGELIITNNLEGSFGPSDYFYYAAAVYTTVGFGDIVPLGYVRLLTGIGALVGLILITWSASYTFLEMQRYWDRERHHTADALRAAESENAKE